MSDADCTPGREPRSVAASLFIRICFYESYRDSSDFSEWRYFMKFKLLYFSSAWRHSQMVGHPGSPTGIVHADMTLTRSKVKVTGLLNFRQLARPCMLAAMTAALLQGFLVCYLCPAFPASHVQHILDLHSKFALGPHHVWKYGRHPICNRWN